MQAIRQIAAGCVAARCRLRRDIVVLGFLRSGSAYFEQHLVDCDNGCEELAEGLCLRERGACSSGGELGVHEKKKQQLQQTYVFGDAAHDRRVIE
jgi:hypothetical protein